MIEMRDNSIASPNERLQHAWEQFMDIVEHDGHLAPNPQLHRHAMRLCQKAQPTMIDLHHLILTTDYVDNAFMGLRRLLTGEKSSAIEGNLLGMFVSAGYQLLPQEEISYPFSTPELSSLGYLLKGKRLVIDGVVGNNIGDHMIGTLVNNGSVGAGAGEGMIGTFINNGAAEYGAGQQMIGVFINTDKKIRGAGINLLGKYNQQWKGVPPKQRDRFLEEITNPRGLSYQRLRNQLQKRYA
jgi:hypothetical protein